MLGSCISFSIVQHPPISSSTPTGGKGN